MMKAIEIEFKTKKYLINQWVILINRYHEEMVTKVIQRGTGIVYKMKKGVTQDNMLSLMTTILECYKGGYNNLRKTVVRHALNLVNQDVFSAAEQNEFNFLNWKLEMIVNWEAHV